MRTTQQLIEELKALAIATPGIHKAAFNGAPITVQDRGRGVGVVFTLNGKRIGMQKLIAYIG